VLTPRMSSCRNKWSQFKSFSRRSKARTAVTRYAACGSAASLAVRAQRSPQEYALM